MSSAHARQFNKINSIAMDGGAILVHSRRAGTCTRSVVYWLMLDSLINLIIMLEWCASRTEFPEEKGRAGLAPGPSSTDVYTSTLPDF